MAAFMSFGIKCRGIKLFQFLHRHLQSQFPPGKHCQYGIALDYYRSASTVPFLHQLSYSVRNHIIRISIRSRISSSFEILSFFLSVKWITQFVPKGMCERSTRLYRRYILFTAKPDKCHNQTNVSHQSLKAGLCFIRQRSLHKYHRQVRQYRRGPYPPSSCSCSRLLSLPIALMVGHVQYRSNHYPSNSRSAYFHAESVEQSPKRRQSQSQWRLFSGVNDRLPHSAIAICNFWAEDLVNVLAMYSIFFSKHHV